MITSQTVADAFISNRPSLIGLMISLQIFAENFDPAMRHFVFVDNVNEELALLSAIGVPRDLPASPWWCPDPLVPIELSKPSAPSSGSLQCHRGEAASPGVVAAELRAEPPAQPFFAVPRVPKLQEDLQAVVTLNLLNLLVELPALVAASFHVVADQHLRESHRCWTAW